MRSIAIFLALGALAFPLSGGAAFADEIVLTIDLPAGCDYELADTPRGRKLGFEGCGYKTAPGGPMLPTKTFLIALPPGTRAGSAEVRLIGARELSGTVDFDPVRLASNPWPVALDGEHRFSGSDGDSPVTGTNHTRQGWISGRGKLRGYGYAAVTVCPCALDPHSGDLLIHGAAEIRLTLESDPDFDLEAGRAPRR